MLTLYGNKMSGSCQKVEYVLQILHVPFENKQLDFQKDLKTDWYLKIHPAGKIPSIDDHGFVLFESGAICRYLCEKHGGQLIPADLRHRALMEQWIDFVNLHVSSAVGKVAFNRVFAPMFGMPVNESSIEAGLKDLDRFFPILDAQIARDGYVAGSVLSLADIALLSALAYVDSAKIDVAKYAHISKWLSGLKSQDWYKKVHQK